MTVTKSIPQIRTEAEIEDLKTQWLADPCWDIEGTEGFEAHAEELERFHEEQSRQWDLESKEREVEGCIRYGCSPQMFNRLRFLESRIDSLERQLDAIQNPD